MKIDVNKLQSAIKFHEIWWMWQQTNSSDIYRCAEKFLRSSRNCKQFDHASYDWSNCVTHDLNNRREKSESFLVSRRQRWRLRRRRRQRTTKLTPHTIADNKCAHWNTQKITNQPQPKTIWHCEFDIFG